MLELPDSLQSSLDARATTFCHCWRIARRDGAVLGFTDHDRDLSFNGVTFRARTGLSASEAESSLGLAVATSEAMGALSDDSLSERDLLNGLYDGAAVETWLVDWRNVDDRTLLDIASIGEVRRGELAFSAELRSSAHVFDQPQGRSFQRGCSADLGDARCKVSLPAYSATGAIQDFSGGVLTLDIATAPPDGFFMGGTLRFSSGANSGATATIKSHRRIGGARAALTLWTPPGAAIAAGDTALLTAGCDKSLASCRDKFANTINFRGFPHMPGNDRALAYATSRDEAMDGGSFFR